MSKAIRIIHLEDIRSDADIVRRELTKGGLSFEYKWVTSKESYEQALKEFSADIILSDHSLPGFSSAEAFHILKESGQDIPFILVTATVSEEFAVTMMQEGVADYLLKDRLQRLPAAITNALEKWEAERARASSHERLVQNEKRFRSLIENSADMIGLSDSKLQPLFVSSSYTRITGRTLEERRQSEIDFIHPDDRRDYYQVLEKVMRKPREYIPVRYRMLHKNGHYIWVEGTIINMLQEEAIGGILFNLRDVTDRVTAEESLKKSQANISAIIENSNASIYSIDRQFRYISFNSLLKDSLKQVYGLEIKVGDHVFDFLKKLDPAEQDQWRRRYTEALSGNRVEFEKEIKFGDHHSFQSFSINPIIEGHYVTGLSCFAWDITPQKTAALKVARSEARFRALIENNHEAITLRDIGGQLLYASPSVYRMLGHRQGEDFDELAKQEIHPDDMEVIRHLYQNVKSSHGIAYPATFRLRRKSGDYIWLEGVITNLMNDEHVKGVISNFRDVTERKANEHQREKITLDLVERNKNLEQYAYIVSHNLRAPVANILGISNLLEMSELTDTDRQQSLEHLFSSARKLDEVIRDLNLILQMRQNIGEKKQEVNLEAMVGEVMSGMTSIDINKVTISTDFKVPLVSTVKSYLYSIFYNLISNSIKYSREGVGAIIRISSDLAGDRVRLCFADNGMGIDLDAHGESIFGLYKRFHHGHAEGKGIGLFMTKTQVETLGGRISIKSEVNQGTEFIVEL
ncbi:MAG TPA: PAS domain S-box protein [Cyclobacteriaceae bacterium]|nr:PAS domain S-box protein [Cyclobacteriaceae bacterium]